MIDMRCPSCTCVTADAAQPGETFFQAKARLRASLGAECPRGSAFPCPMRGESPGAFDRETLAALQELESAE